YRMYTMWRPYPSMLRNPRSRRWLHCGTGHAVFGRTGTTGRVPRFHQRARRRCMPTGNTVKLGWKAGPEQYPPLALLDYAVVAEQAGFETIDVSDHFHLWDDSGQACFTWTWQGAVVVKTSTIELGTGITCPILRYHPAVIAQAAAILGVMAPGRAYLAVG